MLRNCAAGCEREKEDKKKAQKATHRRWLRLEWILKTSITTLGGGRDARDLEHAGVVRDHE